MRQFLRRWLLTLALVLAAAPLAAQPAAEPTPDQVKSLLQLLGDPVVKSWLEREMAAPDRGAASPAATPEIEGEITTYFEGGLADLKAHLAALVQAVPGLPAELAAVEGRLVAELEAVGWLRVILLISAFVGLGAAVERAFWMASRRLRDRVAAARSDTPAARGRIILARLTHGVVGLLAFAAGSIGAFLALPWPPALRTLVLGFLLAFLTLRAAMVIARLLLSPRVPGFRIVPMDDRMARLWHRSVIRFVGWFAFGYVTIQLLRRLGIEPLSAALLAYLLGLGLVLIALHLTWRSTASLTVRWLATAVVVLSYLAWIVGLKPVMWTLVVAGAAALLLPAGRRAVEHLFRGADETGPASSPLSPAAVIVDRALRFVLIVCGLALLAWGWDIDYGALANQDDVAARLVRGGLHAAVILLVADLLWKLASTAIDRRITAAGPVGAHDLETVSTLAPEEERRQARIRTLLPIVRIFLAALLLVMAVLMALSALGVQVGPLIAGAGVIGVAIGFGSQTLVRDIISGMFYLMDDAFRVGEYIVSGSFRGTVEGFSLRSIRLRHHRGPLFTVPFGNLGAVQNLSRDWVIDKITFNVPFDTDVAKVKKIVKQVSAGIMADPDLAKGILEPLKSQGVYAMNDFAMQIRVKFKAKPGGQFAVRRAAYDRIKRALAENGIHIALPTVTVAGGDGSGAAAQQALLAGQRDRGE
ncbi:MAG: mechanosensitive ion channel [Geminicoccaceae bacterium]